ncbi:MAG: Crp/Fnr family transcriptional regulator [Planctomycetota bacterium]|nr:Crp/Fnr family transcriptional regulator [Planctomycetota bacterium]
METASDMSPWLEGFPSLAQLESPELRRLLETSPITTFEAGETIMGVGQMGGSFPMVVSGTLRVTMLSNEGREILLYRLREGNTCTLSTACLLSGDRLGATVSAERPLSIVALGPDVFHRLLDESKTFRNFVFEAFGSRMADLIQRIDELVFQSIEERLAGTLLELERDGIVHATHQELAIDMGTAREVVSRQVKELETQGAIQLGRGRITILDRGALTRLLPTR